MKKSLLLVIASYLLALSPVMAEDTVITNSSLFVADKTWHWEPTDVNGGAVWGNGGYQAGPQAGDKSINGAWWGCGPVDGDCADTFVGQLQHSAVGVLTGEEYTSSYMVFKTDGRLEKYYKGGTLLNTGKFEIKGWREGQLIYEYGYGTLNTTAGSILWPYQINSGGYQPENFEISYISPERLILTYARPGAGGWSECTWWSFGSDDGVGLNPDYGKNYVTVDGIRYSYLAGEYSVRVEPLLDGKYEGEIEIPEYIEIPSDDFSESNGYFTTLEVKEIHHNAFADCPDLKKITLNQKLRIIYPEAFKNCVGLEEIELITLDSDYIQVDKEAFDGVDVSKIKLTVFDGLDAIYRGASVWNDFNIQPKPFELIIGCTKAIEKTICIPIVGVKDYPSLYVPHPRVFSNDADIIKVGYWGGLACVRPGKATIGAQCYNTIAETEIEVLEAYKLPAEDDSSYIVELLAEGKDLYFINCNNESEVFLPDANGVFTFRRCIDLYSRLPKSDGADWMYFMSFDTNIMTDYYHDGCLEMYSYFMNVEVGESVWRGNAYYFTRFYYDISSDVTNYTLLLDPKEYESFTPKDLCFWINTGLGQVITLSNMKVYRIKSVDSIRDIIYSSDLDTQYYTLEGIRTPNPIPGHVYIKVEGGKATKTLFR